MKPNISKKYFMSFEETARNKVFKVLSKYPKKEFSLSDLARESGVAKANIANILNEFQEAGVITIEKLSKIWRIRANQSNQLYIRNKIIYNLSLIYGSGLVDFLIDYFQNPKSILLFGSFSKGEDISDSDIDIAVEQEDIKEYKTIELRELSEFEKIFSRKIQIHLFNRKVIDLHVFNNIANGILLWGFLEVKK